MARAAGVVVAVQTMNRLWDWRSRGPAVEMPVLKWRSFSTLKRRTNSTRPAMEDLMFVSFNLLHVFMFINDGHTQEAYALI